MEAVTVFWFRRDLRLEDNTGLAAAIEQGRPVLPLFIFDSDILDKLEDRDDCRVQFIYEALQHLHHNLQKEGSGFCVRHGRPLEVFKHLGNDFRISAVYANSDYEPYARKRDREIKEYLESLGIPLRLSKDQVIFEKDDVIKPDGTPYTVYTPYSRTWKKRLSEKEVVRYPAALARAFLPLPGLTFPSLESLGFKAAGTQFRSPVVPADVIRHYSSRRDFPAEDGTTHLGVHLRFGTIGIRTLLEAARDSEVFVNELTWREFFMQVLYHFPFVAEKPFREKFESVTWRHDENDFQKWCEGRTGYPMVDAGMRQLAATGFMHNRLRMVTASFLSKHLLLDYRWGEAWFARKLMDFDLASNNGNWQWAAGCGCDAAPWFRMFNPAEQARRFDPEEKYIRRWVPEINTPEYPAPIVDHAFARERALALFGKAVR